MRNVDVDDAHPAGAAAIRRIPRLPKTLFMHTDSRAGCLSSYWAVPCCRQNREAGWSNSDVG